MIVRLMGAGQYKLDDACLEHLNRHDAAATAAIDAGDQTRLETELKAMWGLVQREGTPLPDDSLDASDALVPPDDLSLEEAGRLLGDEGFVPDLPS